MKIKENSLDRIVSSLVHIKTIDGAHRRGGKPKKETMSRQNASGTKESYIHIEKKKPKAHILPLPVPKNPMLCIKVILKDVVALPIQERIRRRK